MSQTIVLTTKHKVPFIIDTANAELVLSKTWCICYYGYPATSVRRKLVLLHHYLFGNPPDGLEWDHKDRNKLNNMRGNLRLVSRQTNSRNKNPQKNNKSGVSGVGFRPTYGKWRARIKTNGVEICLGHFDTLEDAIKARKQGETKHWGTNV